MRKDALAMQQRGDGVHRTWPRGSVSADTARSRIIVDLTDVLAQLARGQKLTGIPRVVLEFASEARAIAGRKDVEIVYGYFDQAAGHFLRLDIPPTDPSRNAEMDFISHLSGRNSRMRGHLINIPSIQAKYVGRPIKRRLQTAKGQFRLLGRRLSYKLGSSLLRRATAAPLAFREGDVFLMLGSGWYALPLLDYLRPYVKSAGIRPVILVHDLIPLLDTGEAPPIVPQIFEHWLNQAAALTNDFIVYSAATRSDLLSYFNAAGRIAPNVHLAPLVHELKVGQESPLSPDIARLRDANFALFVGPCTGRKNALRLFEAWRILLDRLGPERTPLLVVTDGRGADKVAHTHLRSIASHIRILNTPSDGELSSLYAKAAFTVFPSLYEGWGLPVGESLWHGTPCIASNISAIPEVGGELCDYVDPYDVASIAEAVERLVRDPAHRNARAAAIRQHKFRRWSDFAEDIIDILTNPPIASAKHFSALN
jgi:glycosyltransferase involved in cell wall biosynthesis